MSTVGVDPGSGGVARSASTRVRPTNAAYIEPMSEVKITALENGPLEVDGGCAVLASDGTSTFL